MIDIGEDRFWTRRALCADLAALGLGPGDSVMVHAGLRAVGPMFYGPDALIGALRDAVGPMGTLLCYLDWDACYHDALDADGRVPDALKADILPYDPLISRANRDHGAIAEFIRTTPGTLRSANAGASVGAIGARAEWFIADHPLDYGYGPGSPFAKLVEAGGKVLMIGAPLDTMSILHHAEHLADIPGKRLCRVEVPNLVDGVVEWRMIEEFDTADPVVDGLDDDYFAQVVEDYLCGGEGHRGRVGNADSVLVDAAGMVDFAVRWLERRFA